jgi:hypothetical protein
MISLLHAIYWSAPLTEAQAATASAVLGAAPHEGRLFANVRDPRLVRRADGRIDLRGRDTNREQFEIQVHPDRLEVRQTPHLVNRIVFTIWMGIFTALAVLAVIKAFTVPNYYLLLAVLIPAFGVLVFATARRKDQRTLLRLLGVN